jgi:cytochrome c-type biogenesis protein CcmH
LIFAMPAAAQLSVEDEARAREVGATLRCVVCQNQSIEESDAILAQDMRRIVRDRIAAGDSQAEVTAYMRERYGDYVLLKPPVQTNTYVLWFLPAAIVLAMAGWLLVRRRRTDSVDLSLSPEERARLDALLGEDT